VGLNPEWTVWLRWPDPEDGPLHVGLTMAGRAAALIGVEIRTEAAGSLTGLLLPPEPLPASALRDLPLDRIAAQARAQMAEALEAEALEAEGDRREAALGAVEALRATWPHRFPRGHYGAVATVYREAVAIGADPLAVIRETWMTSKSTAARWVMVARHDLGLLPHTTRGKPAA